MAITSLIWNYEFREVSEEPDSGVAIEQLMRLFEMTMKSESRAHLSEPECKQYLAPDLSILHVDVAHQSSPLCSSRQLDSEN